MHKSKTRILVLGASGMLGSTLFRAFSRDPHFETFGSLRDTSNKRHFQTEFHDNLISNIYLDSEYGLLAAFSAAKPEIVINCIGIIKQSSSANDRIENLLINSILPHRLYKYCEAIGARLVHFSTDCVFSGKQGLYKEGDFPDAYDLYGRTKFLGEVVYDRCITLRTSIIGHELNGSKSLVDWFLSKSCGVKGFTKAIFSGIPTIEVARILKEFVIPKPNLKGLYHLSADPISKFKLLNLIAMVYEKNIQIIPDDETVIDRSLNSDRFRTDTGYSPRSWPEMIDCMHKEYLLTH